MRKYIEEYRNSLKHPEAEEIVDLLFFRPVAFILVKTIYRLPVTPNQISLLSIAAGLASALFLSIGEIDSYRMGAIFLLGANTLDCMDGQLARLQGSGTFFGRVVDGVADYITGIAIFVALGLGLKGMHESIWLFVAAAGISTIIQAMAFDHYQGDFIKVRTGKGNITTDELNEFCSDKDNAIGQKSGRRQTFLIRIYLSYLKLQEKSRIIFPGSVYHPEGAAGKLRSTIRFWSYLGLSTNRSILIIFCLLGIPEYFLYSILLGSNLWLVVCLFLQYLVSNQYPHTTERS